MIVEIDYYDYLLDKKNSISAQMNTLSNGIIHLESTIGTLKEEWKNLEKQRNKISDQLDSLLEKKKEKPKKEETILPLKKDQIKNINLDYPAKIIKFKFKSEKDLEEFYKFYKSVMR